MDTKQHALLRTHLGYLCMGIVPVFAKLIPWDAISIICGRMIVAAVAMLLYMSYRKAFWKEGIAKEWFMLLVTGIVLAVHWSTFFLAIQVSSVPLAVVIAGTIPIYTALIEPLIHGHLPKPIDMALSAVVFLGVCVLTEDFSLQSANALGILFGTICAITKALRDIWSKRLIRTYGSAPIMFFQLSIGGIALLPFFAHGDIQLTGASIAGILTLGILGTAIAHTLTMSGMQRLSAASVTLIGNLCVVYQMGLAALVLGELPTTRIIMGGVIIMSACGYETWRQQKSA